jgi:hypothetical protein
MVGHEHNLNIEKTTDGFTKKERFMTGPQISDSQTRFLVQQNIPLKRTWVVPDPVLSAGFYAQRNGDYGY